LTAAPAKNPNKAGVINFEKRAEINPSTAKIPRTKTVTRRRATQGQDSAALALKKTAAQQANRFRGR
jgi:hypothetical protein